MALFRLERALIRVSGADRVVFLDNLLTQNVEGLDGVRYGALLSPQGKVIADMLLWAVGETIVIETDPKFGEALLRRLNMYKLRARVALENAGDLCVAYSPAPFDAALADPRMPDGALGWRRLAPRAETDALADGDDVFAQLRIGAGVPDLAVDAQSEEVFAGEALLDELRGVDFQKGCFVGQENVSRMKRRATTRRKFCAVAFDGEAIAYGTPVRAGAADIGTMRSAQTGRGIALMRLDRALEAHERGEKLMAGEREIRLDPPAWLILPPTKLEGAAGDD
ncbi:MAG: folate-binding protein [Terricaulis sp.]